MQQENSASRAASQGSSPVSPESASSGPGQAAAATAVASALFTETSDPSSLRHVERCTEASCSQRTEETLRLRRLHGLTGPDPPDRLELGQSAWAVLHTSAALFPMDPTREERKRMQAWLCAFFKLYPCGECRSHMAPYVKEHPIDATDGERLSAWLCYAHNFVNKDLDKDLFSPCDGAALRCLYTSNRSVRRPDFS